MTEGEKTRRRREGGTVNFFLSQKEKSLQKRSWQPCRLIAYAPINFLARFFPASKGAVPQMAVLPTPEIKRLESVGSRTDGFDLMGAVRVRLLAANHGTQTVWVCVPRFVGISIKWMQGCADGTSSPPTWGFVPTVCRRTDSDSFSPSADGFKPLSGKGVAGVSLTG